MQRSYPTKGDRTRAEIVDAANRLFTEQGYHGTSMRQIAQEAGIALGGIYNHYASKEDIFITVIDAYHPYHEIFPIIQEAQGETVEAFVRDAAQGLVAALGCRPNFLNLMLIEIVEFNSKHIPLLFDRFFPNVMDVVQRFSESQSNLRSVPLPMVVRIFLGLIYSYYIFEKLLSERFPVEMQGNALEHSVDVFLNGILSGE